MQFSHHSSNPLEARKSDPRNASYKARLQAAEAEAGYDESSDDPLAMTIKQQKYIDHLRETLGAELLPPKRAATIKARPVEEQLEIQQEIEQLYDSVPEILDEYELIDRLGTGTFSSVYKAVDLRYNAWDNQPWLGHHPPESTAYYQSAGPGYKGRGGRASGNVYVAIKRIYTTSGPERIRNELSIMEACRGCRHTSQIITAFRNEDQVVIVLPYQRNMDFRDFYQTLHPEGIKCYLRCLFRALRDIHARGIIHRDVKPANFLYDPFTGIGTLCDFGLASTTPKNKQRLETTTPHTLGRCYHTPATAQDPHGKNRQLDQYETAHIKQAQKDARAKSAAAPEKVGYPEQDKRPLSKANRAGTRGFRAPEVLLKCSAQTGAIDVWSAGIILLFFLTGKFPIFQSNDDIEGLMEIAIIIGKKKIEKVATLHGRTFATNVPELDQDGISWEQFVERLNPDIWKPRKYDMRFYPHNSKHRDGRGSASASTSTTTPAPVPEPTPSSPAPAPPSTDPSSGAPSDPPPPPPLPLASDRHLNPPSAERHTRELRLAFHFLEQVLQVESTKRYTPRKALYHTFLDEAGADGDDQFVPHPIGAGVCGAHHELDSRGVHWARDEEGAKGHMVEEQIELQAGEGVPIGQKPCEYHRNLGL
ncbi:kinase-like protein [Pholiota molesta]|nr:kinase-like protein [Pholiota molesta]